LFYVKDREHTVKKRFAIFPSPAGLSLTKISVAGNNLYKTSLFPPRESLVSDNPARDGKIVTFFCNVLLLNQIIIEKNNDGTTER
jgi:hypothetical protein